MAAIFLASARRKFVYVVFVPFLDLKVTFRTSRPLGFTSSRSPHWRERHSRVARPPANWLRESEIDRSEWPPYGLAQQEKSPNPEFPLACVAPCLWRILHQSLLEGEQTL